MSKELTDYYQLELDDMVIALNNKDADIELLQKKLDIAVKALKEYATNESYKLCVVYCHYGEPVHASDVAIQALKEMEGVK